MKEIWMEKLIDLLNEYERERVNHSMIDFIPYWEKSLNDLSVAQVISKKYWFIKWLVENDKIDYHNKINYHISLAIHREIKKTTREERLLMMLAIQDEPIKFLCSLLK